jgi:hypothetical protein
MVVTRDERLLALAAEYFDLEDVVGMIPPNNGSCATGELPASSIERQFEY